MLRVAIIIFVTALTSPMFLRGIEDGRGPVLIRFGEINEDAGVSGSASECLVVRSNGKYHLERRDHHPGTATNYLSTYNGELSKTDLNMLRNLLNDPRLKALADYTAPHFPLSTASFRIVTLDYYLSGKPKTVGYFMPRSYSSQNLSPQSGATTSPNSQWVESEQVLRPVVSWVEQLIPTISVEDQGGAVDSCELEDFGH
jgi:hypothetical protein